MTPTAARATHRSLLALIASILLTLGISPQAFADTLELADGHVDAFTVTSDGVGLNLEVKEDITGHGVRHRPEDVTFRVHDAAYSTDLVATDGIASDGYLLPLVQQPGLLWPGWDTLEVSGTGFHAIDIVFDTVTGPGNVYLFSTAPFNPQPVSLLSDGGLALRSGSIRHQAEPAHTHAYWMFTAPGVYTFDVHVQGDGPAGLTRSNTHRYTWLVGDAATLADAPTNGADTPAPAPGLTDDVTPVLPPVIPDPAPAPAPAPKPVPAPAPKPAPAPAPAPQRDGSSGSSGSSDNRGTTHQQVSNTNECRPRPGTGKGLIAQVKDDTVNPPVWRDPASLTFSLGPAAKNTTPQAIGSIPAGSEVYSIGATQVAGVPWLGANTMNDALLNATTGDVTWSLSSFSGPGSMEVFTSGNFGTLLGQTWFSGSGTSGNGQVTIGRNTHVHPNWVFSAPGTYRVGITQTATATDGSTLTGTTTLTFEVGGTSGITHGHFDLGATVGDAAVVYTLPDGTPCTPGAGTDTGAGSGSVGGSSLANTGLGGLVWPIVVAAIGFLALGGALIHAALHGGLALLPKGGQ